MRAGGRAGRRGGGAHIQRQAQAIHVEDVLVRLGGHRRLGEAPAPWVQGQSSRANILPCATPTTCRV